MRRPTLFALAILFVASSVRAQVLLPPDAPTLQLPASPRQPALVQVAPSLSLLSTAAAAAAQSPQPAGNRACDGCPPRRIGTALFQATMINVFYGLGNLARGEETAKVTPETWWKNMQHGWEWDLNDFTTNQWGHPYQGNNYYTAG